MHGRNFMDGVDTGGEMAKCRMQDVCDAKTQVNCNGVYLDSDVDHRCLIYIGDYVLESLINHYRERDEGGVYKIASVINENLLRTAIVSAVMKIADNGGKRELAEKGDSDAWMG